MEQTFIHTLHPVQVKELVRAWLREDTPHFDFGGYVVGENKEKAQLLGKSAGILAGKPFVDAVFRELDCDVEWFVSEGEEIQPVRIIAIVTGKARNLLLGERVALNCIARTSGIATYCQKLRNMAVNAKWHGRIAGTRKTTPGFRLAEKYAMIVGGVDTHRYDLSSMIMLKDNHIESVGCIEKAVNNAKLVGGFSLKVEVECRSLQEALEAAKSKADIIMLDNFKHQDLHIAARQIKLQYPNVIIEASGGITESNIHKYFGSDIDIISLSRISQGYSVVDFSLKIIKSENKISLLPKSTST